MKSADHTSPLRQMVKLQEKTHGPNSKETAKALCALADAYAQIDDVTNASACYEQACAIYETLKDDRPLAQCRRMLEELKCQMTGDLEVDEEALTLSSFNIPVFVRGAQGGDDDTMSGASLAQSILLEDKFTAAKNDELTIPPTDKDPLDEAISLSRDEIARLRQKGLGTTSQLADALRDLAGLYSKKNRPDKMEPLLQEALQIRESVYGASHMNVSTDLKNLGRAYFLNDKFVEAEKSLRRAIEIREAQLGAFHPQVADLADFCARLLHKMNRTAEAKDLEKRVEESRARHPSEWEDYKKAAIKAIERENFFEAQALWLAAMDECANFDAEDPRVLTTVENLAFVYWKRAKFDKAEPLCRRILERSEQLLGKDHFDVAVAANNLALINERLEKYTEAAVLYQSSLRVMELSLGDEHPDVLEIKSAHKKALDMAHKQLAQKLQKSL